MPDVDCIGSLSTQLVYLSLKEHILTLFKSSSAAPPKPIFEHRSLEPGLNNPARCRVVVAVVLWCGGRCCGWCLNMESWLRCCCGTAVDCGGLLTNSRPQSRMGRDSVNTWAQCSVISTVISTVIYCEVRTPGRRWRQCARWCLCRDNSCQLLLLLSPAAQHAPHSQTKVLNMIQGGAKVLRRWKIT